MIILYNKSFNKYSKANVISFIIKNLMENDFDGLTSLTGKG